MRPYGYDRICGRKIRGTSRDCPCCIPKKQAWNPRSVKKRERQRGQRESRGAVY